LDIGLGLLLLAFTWQLITQASTRDGFLSWRWLGQSVEVTDKINPLFRLLHKGFGVDPQAAYRWTNALSMLLTFGVPIGLALLTWKRPLRLALCLGAVLLGNAFYTTGADKNTLYRDRSYFGILRVMREVDYFFPEKAGDEKG